MTVPQLRCPVCNQFHETVQMNEDFGVLEPCAMCQGQFWTKPDEGVSGGEVEHFVLTDYEDEDFGQLGVPVNEMD